MVQVHALSQAREKLAGVSLVLCPSAPLLPLLQLELAPRPADIALGAQDVSAESAGNRTGEIEATLLATWCRYAIIGHSERRQYQVETDEIISRKLQQAQSAGLTPLLCVGEQTQGPEAAAVVVAQAEAVLRPLAPAPQIIFAYEPIWAIGAAEPASADYAQMILQALLAKWPQSFVLYGGAVTATTARQYLDVGFAGLLLGRASLKTSDLLAVIDAVRH